MFDWTAEITGTRDRSGFKLETEDTVIEALVPTTVSLLCFLLIGLNKSPSHSPRPHYSRPFLFIIFTSLLPSITPLFTPESKLIFFASLSRHTLTHGLPSRTFDCISYAHRFVFFSFEFLVACGRCTCAHKSFRCWFFIYGRHFYVILFDL